jgi:hypothetical protein
MSGGAIEPLCVIDHAEQRLLLGDRRQQAQHCQPDQEAIGRLPGAQSERHAERLALRLGNPGQPIEHWRAHLLQGGERELHLRLDADRAYDPEPRRRRDRVLQERGLAHPRLAPHHQHAAAPCARILQQAIQHLALAAPAEEQLSRPPRDHGTPTIPTRPRRPRGDYEESGVRTTRLLIRSARPAATLRAPKTTEHA